jgi:hypothetical protein
MDRRTEECSLKEVPEKGNSEGMGIPPEGENPGGRKAWHTTVMQLMRTIIWMRQRSQESWMR